ncbi:MAG: type II toxin-antitoxin system VapC family toxin [Planctomycetota bacterium]
MILLDTDHLNILQIGKGIVYHALAARMNASADQHFVTTVVTFEEHMRGWLAGIRRARDVSKQVRPYDQLINLVRFFQAWELLRFDENAARRFGDLRRQRIRVGSQDLKIACIALEMDATLLSANLGDFSQVPGLRVEDWLH